MIFYNVFIKKERRGCLLGVRATRPKVGRCMGLQRSPSRGLAPVPAHVRTRPCPLQGGSQPLLGHDLGRSQWVIAAASSFPCALEAQRKIHSARQPFRCWRERHWISSEHPSSSLQLSPMLAALLHPSYFLQLHRAVPSGCQHRFRI